MNKSILKIGLDFAAPIPLHTDYHSTKFEGFEVDLMNKIAAELNLELRHTVSYWKDILQELQSGKIDVICSAATVTPEREKFLIFSKPYLNFRLCIICRKDYLVSFNELEKKKVGVRVNTEAEKYVKNNFINAELATFDTNDEQYEALKNKELDAIIDDSPIANGFVRQNPQLTISDFLPNSSSQYAIAVKKENIDLKNRIDDVIDRLNENGFLQNNLHKWFSGMEL